MSSNPRSLQNLTVIARERFCDRGDPQSILKALTPFGDGRAPCWSLTMTGFLCLEELPHSLRSLAIKFLLLDIAV
ncbi:hypothetical protein [Fodinibius sp.]|uniref:hypothetical protein n=1 Tax=Fodinibius sp. TaxID=1872440 RepID=UPI002ACE30B5|nr:hypothetical protein [Fodinibius sp.]MDZ7660304.1 hypothetical protein [Fodinibius sp.]